MTQEPRDAVVRALAAYSALKRGELPLSEELDYVPDPPIRVRAGPGYVRVEHGYECTCEACLNCESQDNPAEYDAFMRGWEYRGREDFVLGLLAGLMITAVAWAMKG